MFAAVGSPLDRCGRTRRKGAEVMALLDMLSGKRVSRLPKAFNLPL